jgi:hypothetical protein
MSTTSSSRADRVSLALVLLLAAACATTQAVAPEGPRQGRHVKPDRPPATGTRDERVEVESVTIHRASEQPELMRRLGNLPIDAPETVLIDVRTAQPLGDTSRSASPVIVLDGQTLNDTYPIDQRRLVAAIPARSLRAGEHSIVITWLGAEATTTSRRAFVFRVP